jgi:hypothetical protein
MDAAVEHSARPGRPTQERAMRGTFAMIAGAFLGLALMTAEASAQFRGGGFRGAGVGGRGAGLGLLGAGLAIGVLGALTAPQPVIIEE